jgi:DNA-binding response OmpR family regulator
MLIDRELPTKGPTDSRRSALIVDGDPELRKSISRHLELMDFDVLSANHYDGAVHHLASREFHFACVDVQLPSKSGYELCEHIRGSLGFVGLPILMTSDYGDPGDMAYAESAGANAFLHKPFSMRQLAQCIESLLNLSRAAPPLSSALQGQVSPSLRAAIRGNARALEVRKPTQNAYRALCGVGLSTH